MIKAGLGDWHQQNGGFMMFAFISRHTPTREQLKMATDMGIELVHVGDADGFSVAPSYIHGLGPFEGVVVVHPGAALNLCQDFIVGVFENGTRPTEGGKPEFYAKSLTLWDLRE